MQFLGEELSQKQASSQSSGNNSGEGEDIQTRNVEQIKSFESNNAKEKFLRRFNKEARDAFQVDLMPSFSDEKLPVFKDRNTYALPIEEEDEGTEK